MTLPQIFFEGDAGAPAGGGGGQTPPGSGESAPSGGEGAGAGDATPNLTVQDLATLLPEDLAGSPSLKKFETPEALAKSYLELERSRENYLRIPTEDAGQEDQDKFYTTLMEKVPGLMRTPSDDPEVVKQVQRQLGAPEDADGYKIPEIDNMGIELDMSTIDTFRGIAAKNGLTQAQFEDIVKSVSEGNIQRAVEAQRQQDADKQALVGEWGVSYDERVKQITNFARNTGAPDALVEALANGSAGAATTRWMQKIVSQMAGEGGDLTRTASGETLLSTTQAKQQIADIMNNKEHAYWNPQAFGHAEAKKKMQDLYRQAHPGGQGGLGTVGVGSQVNFE